MAATAVGNEGAFNSTTAVEIVAAPASATQRVVAPNGISIYNDDTVNITMTLRKLKGASTYKLDIKTLAPGDTYYNPKPIILDATNESITAVLAGAITTNQPHFDAAMVDYS